LLVFYFFWSRGDVFPCFCASFPVPRPIFFFFRPSGFYFSLSLLLVERLPSTFPVAGTSRNAFKFSLMVQGASGEIELLFRVLSFPFDRAVEHFFSPSRRFYHLRAVSLCRFPASKGAKLPRPIFSLRLLFGIAIFLLSFGFVSKSSQGPIF